MSKDLDAIYADIAALSPPDKLRFAALLLESQRAEMAKAIIDRVGTELGAAQPAGKRGRL